MKSTNEHSYRRGCCCCKFWRPVIPPAKITCVFLLLNNYLGKVTHLLGQKLKRKLLLAPLVSENPLSTIQDAVIKLRWERPFAVKPAVSSTAQDSIPRLNPQETLPSHSQEQSPLVQVKMKEEKENSNNFSKMMQWPLVCLEDSSTPCSPANQHTGALSHHSVYPIITNMHN